MPPQFVKAGICATPTSTTIESDVEDAVQIKALQPKKQDTIQLKTDPPTMN